jgi:hypothetical protein
MIQITKPGEPFPKAEKRAGDRITYQLDLNNILEKNEIAISIDEVKSPIEVNSVRTRLGKFIEIQVMPNDIGASQYLEFQLTIGFETNLNNSKSATFNLRTYK